MTILSIKINFRNRYRRKYYGMDKKKFLKLWGGGERKIISLLKYFFLNDYREGY